MATNKKRSNLKPCACHGDENRNYSTHVKRSAMLLSSIADKTVQFNIYDVFESNFQDAPQYLEFNNCDESLYKFRDPKHEPRNSIPEGAKQELNEEFQAERFAAQQFVCNKLQDLAGSSCNVVGHFKLVGMYVMDLSNIAESVESQDRAIETVAELSDITTMKAAATSSDAEVRNSVQELTDIANAHGENLRVPDKLGNSLTPLQIKRTKEGIRQVADLIDELEVMQHQGADVKEPLRRAREDIAKMREKFRIGMSSTRMHMNMD
jgi:hypothetical protein